MVRFVEFLNQFNHICWYPSAGTDYRPTLYFTPGWAEMQGWDEKEFPDCFIMSDCSLYDDYYDAYLSGESNVLFEDNSTKITVTHAEELEPISVPANREVVYNIPNLFTEDDTFCWPPVNYGRVLALDAHIKSDVLGEYDTHIVLVRAENAALAFDYFLPNHIHIDMIYRMNYGYRWALEGVGGRSNGLFVTKLLQEFGTRYFVTDDGLPIDAKDPVIDILYKDKIMFLPSSELTEVHRIPRFVAPQWRRYERARYLANSVIFYRVGAALPPHPEEYFQSYVQYELMVHPHAFFGESVTNYKNRLLLEMVRIHVERHPNITFEELKDVFPNWERKGSVIARYEVAAEMQKKDTMFYMGEEDRIHLSDGSEVVVTRRVYPREYLKLLVHLEKYHLVAKPAFWKMGDV